jgi:PAS domain S-box-containing protein
MSSAPNPEPILPVQEALPLLQGLTQLHEAVALVDEGGSIVWMSDALTALCGARHQGRSWRELIATADGGQRLTARLREAGRLFNEPVALRTEAGELPARLSAARLGPGCAARATVAILRVDGDSERAGRELRHTVDYLSAILDSSPEGVVVVDGSRFITYANPAMADLTGFAPAEMVDRPLALFLRSQDDLERIAAALRPESPLRGQDLEIRRRDGSSCCVSVSVSVLRLRDGTPMGAVAYVHDVTERRRFEQEMARKSAELEHYVDAVSHDLRSPLMSLLGFTRLLREDYGERLDDKGRHFLRRVEEAGRTMEDLIRDLLELSRIGKTPRSEESVDPLPVLLQLYAEIKPRLDAQGVNLRLPDDTPLLCCNRTRLYQIFSNLIGNALDHMGPVERPAILVEVEEAGDAHVVRVADNGRGIDPVHHERIFEVFHSLGPRRDGRRGTGVGLAIVRKIAETQGGSAWVESEPGRGACFCVRLPR